MREVAVDGRVTVPERKPPEGRWPVAAVSSGLVFSLPDGRLQVWDPRSGELVRSLPSGFPVASFGDLLAWCDEPCRTLHITNVVTGLDDVVDAPGAYAFDQLRGAFSPDGRTIGLPVLTDRHPASSRSELALVSVETGAATVVEGTEVHGYVFVDWSPSGETVFITGGDRFENRTIMAYRLGDDRAKELPVTVGDFYGMAAG
jgi:hypothetical protein